MIKQLNNSRLIRISGASKNTLRKVIFNLQLSDYWPQSRALEGRIDCG